MRKISLALVLMMAFLGVTWAFAAQPIITGDMVSASQAVSITDNATTHGYTKAVWVGTSQSIDLYVVQTGAWVTFQGAVAGTLIPIQVSGARKTSGSAAPSAGDIVFLY